jgi:hypothetical protein
MRLRSAKMPAQQPNGVLEPREPPSLTAFKEYCESALAESWQKPCQAGSYLRPVPSDQGLRTGKYAGLLPEL